MLATLLLALPSKHFYLKVGGFIWWRATATERIHEKNAPNAYLSMSMCKQTGLPEHEFAERWLGVSSHRFWQTWASSLTAQEIVGCHQWQWATQTHIPADGTEVASLWCRDRVTQLRAEKSEIFLEIVVVTTSAGILLPNISLEKERSCQSYLEQSKTSKNAGPWSHLGDVLIEKITLKSSWWYSNWKLSNT